MRVSRRHPLALDRSVRSRSVRCPKCTQFQLTGSTAAKCSCGVQFDSATLEILSDEDYVEALAQEQRQLHEQSERIRQLEEAATRKREARAKARSDRSERQRKAAEICRICGDNRDWRSLVFKHECRCWTMFFCPKCDNIAMRRDSLATVRSCEACGLEFDPYGDFVEAHNRATSEYQRELARRETEKWTPILKHRQASGLYHPHADRPPPPAEDPPPAVQGPPETDLVVVLRQQIIDLDKRIRELEAYEQEHRISLLICPSCKNVKRFGENYCRGGQCRSASRRDKKWRPEITARQERFVLLDRIRRLEEERARTQQLLAMSVEEEAAAAQGRLVELRIKRFELSLPRAPADPLDFEFIARDWLEAWGDSNAIVTAQSGDGGIDIHSDNCVAQVKFYAGKQVGRPEVQGLKGAAHGTGRWSLFFAYASGYTTEAIVWADFADVALFTFDVRTLSFFPQNEFASEVMKGLANSAPSLKSGLPHQT